MTTRCDRQDHVLARFLDGDPGETCVAEFDLTAHLEGCGACQAALTNARRLDAVVARHSSVDVPDTLADRLLTRAVLPPQPAHHGRTPHGSTSPGRFVAGTAVLLLVCGLGVWIGTGLSTSRDVGYGGAVHRSETATTDAATRLGPREILEVDPGMLRLPAAARRPRVRRSVEARAFARSPEEVLRSTALARELVPGVILASGLRSLLTPASASSTEIWARIPVVADRLATRARIEAGETLMRSRRGADRARFFAFLAESADQVLVPRLLERARAHPPTIRHLLRSIAKHSPGDRRPNQRRPNQRRLDNRRGEVSELATDLRVASRLGHPKVDRELLRLVRRDPPLAHGIAAAIGSVTPRPDRVVRLLDLWDAVRHRGPVSKEETIEIEAWFRQLPSSEGLELLDLAENSAQTERGLRCLGAVAARRDPLAVPGLLRLVESNRHESALAAGYALSRLPRVHAETKIAAGVKTSRRPHILLAALCGMGSTRPRLWLRTAILSKQENDFLWGGTFTKLQFGVASDLCRRRGRFSD